MNSDERNIFYTDDDADDKDLFREIVSQLRPNYSLEFQKDGEELLDVLKKGVPKPDLLFLDLNMPNKNGFEVLVEMKENYMLSTLPVVVLSTSDDKESIARARNSGATLYVCKPNSYHKLKNTLTSLFTQHWDNITSRNIKEFVFCP